jgi:hypothetical protein
MPAVRSDTIRRFWERVPNRPADECWMWTGPRWWDGYGRAGNRGAHRLSWIIAFGPIPDGLHVCHRCDAPLCVNPAHLFLGTNEDNRRDMLRKARHAHGPAHSEAMRRAWQTRRASQGVR